MPSLELELFGEESDNDSSSDEVTSPRSVGRERKVDSAGPEAAVVVAKTKRTSDTRKFDSKGNYKGKRSTNSGNWATFQATDDAKENRQNNTGKDIPTNSQLKAARARDTFDDEFRDHSVLRAWLKIHQQSSGGSWVDLVVRIEAYLETHGGDLDDWYGTVKPKHKKIAKSRKNLTKAEVLAAAQKAFEEANRPKK